MQDSRTADRRDGGFESLFEILDGLDIDVLGAGVETDLPCLQKCNGLELEGLKTGLRRAKPSPRDRINIGNAEDHLDCFLWIPLEDLPYPAFPKKGIVLTILS